METLKPASMTSPWPQRVSPWGVLPLWGLGVLARTLFLTVSSTASWLFSSFESLLPSSLGWSSSFGMLGARYVHAALYAPNANGTCAVRSFIQKIIDNVNSLKHKLTWLACSWFCSAQVSLYLVWRNLTFPATVRGWQLWCTHDDISSVSNPRRTVHLNPAKLRGTVACLSTTRVASLRLPCLRDTG